MKPIAELGSSSPSNGSPTSATAFLIVEVAGVRNANPAECKMPNVDCFCLRHIYFWAKLLKKLFVSNEANMKWKCISSMNNPFYVQVGHIFFYLTLKIYTFNRPAK